MEHPKSQPHEPRKTGWLRNGNRPGDFTVSARCGAKAKATGEPCRCPAMKNGRCRLHGGKSTGPKSNAGKSKTRMNGLKSGFFTAEARSISRSISKLYVANQEWKAVYRNYVAESDRITQRALYWKQLPSKSEMDGLLALAQKHNITLSNLCEIENRSLAGWREWEKKANWFHKFRLWKILWHGVADKGSAAIEIANSIEPGHYFWTMDDKSFFSVPAAGGGLR